MQTPAQRYHPITIALHWIVAAAVVVAVALGMLSGDAEESDLTALTLALHKSVGITIFTLTIVRLTWRLTHVAPALPAAMPAWQRIAAKLTHGLLYAVIFALPVTGYVGVAARGRETVFFGSFALPRLVPLDRVWSQNARALHEYCQWALYVLLAAHVVAAAYHHFIFKDGLMSRIWPAGRAPLR